MTTNHKPQTTNHRPQCKALGGAAGEHYLHVWLLFAVEIGGGKHVSCVGVWGLGFGVWGLGFGVWGLMCVFVKLPGTAAHPWRRAVAMAMVAMRDTGKEWGMVDGCGGRWRGGGVGEQDSGEFDVVWVDGLY